MDNIMGFAPHAMSGNNTRKSFKVLDVGYGGTNRVFDFYPDCKPIQIDKKLGWDVMKNGLPDGQYDVIFANHFIEHIDDPDLFLDECKKIMSRHTVLDIGTPNLCAWFNRVLFLFGYLPHSYEVSYRKGYGRAFNWNDEIMGGHIRVFSVQALVQMLTSHGFRIISVVGEKSNYPCNFIINNIDKFLTWLNPSLASSFRIKCTLPS